MTIDLARALYHINNATESKSVAKEFKAAFEKSSDLLMSKSESDIVENVLTIQQNVQNEHNSKGVLSLSAVNDSILMWSHYTTDHKGICIGFENQGYFKDAKEVRYQSNYERINGWLHPINEIAERTMYAKSSDWAYEKEHRVVKNSNGCFPFEKDLIKSVIFGCDCQKPDRDRYMKLIKVLGYDSVDFFECHLSKSAYQLEMTRINSC